MREIIEYFIKVGILVTTAKFSSPHSLKIILLTHEIPTMKNTQEYTIIANTGIKYSRVSTLVTDANISILPKKRLKGGAPERPIIDVNHPMLKSLDLRIKLLICLISCVP